MGIFPVLPENTVKFCYGKTIGRLCKKHYQKYFKRCGIVALPVKLPEK